MKILYSLLLLFFSSSVMCQSVDFNDWSYAEAYGKYYLFQQKGIEVSNCDEVPHLYVTIDKESTNIEILLRGALYDEYTGDEVKVKVKYRRADGTFFTGYGADVDVIEFNSYVYTNVDGVYFLLLKPIKFSIIDMFTVGLYDSDQVYFQTSLNGEDKVIRYSLKGYDKAFDYFDTKYNENINPF